MGKSVLIRGTAALVAAVALAVGTWGRESGVPALSKLDAMPTALFIREGDALKQVVSVSVDCARPRIRGEVRILWEGGELRFPAGPFQPGKNAFSISCPETSAPVAAKVVLEAGGEVLEKEVVLKPRRKWTVYLFHHSHTDIGYTELQTRVFKNHAEYLDSVIDYCRETDGYPDEARFRWNIEVTWALQNFIRNRPESRVRELLDLIKAGRVELSGLYLQLSDCFAHEELIRAVVPAPEMARAYGFDVRSAMNNDVTGFSWALPQIFRQAGVRYFATGINETRSRAPLRRPCAFWWESPDGSRILLWNGEIYAFANRDLLLHDEIDISAPRVGEYLAKLEERGDYPRDIVAFNISAWLTDNGPPGRILSDRVKAWNEKYAWPKLRLATMREFFERLEKEEGARLPVYKLGWPDYWTDGVASTAYETGLNRRAHADILAGEIFSALAGFLDPGFLYPADEIREAYESSMFFDEHTWGAWNSIDDPHSELARSQWTIKSSFAYKAREAGKTLLGRSTDRLAGLLRPRGKFAFAVFNPLSWTRTDAVRLSLPEGLREKEGKFRIIDDRTGSEAKFQLVDKGTAFLLARNIPPLGFVTYSVVLGRPPIPARPGARIRGNTIENSFYRVTVDPVSGGISGLFDKILGRELVDKSCPYRLNAYVYENPEGGRKAVDDMDKRAEFKRSTPASARCSPGLHGPVASSLAVRSEPKMAVNLDQLIFLYDDIKRVDLVNVLNKKKAYEPEAVYFAFPFDAGKTQAAPGSGGPGVRFEIADSDMAPESEQLPLTTRDWQTVQHWVEFTGRGLRIIWSPVEAPLVEFGDINTGKWLKNLDLPNAWVFSYAMNNYWMTNFKAFQDGPTEFWYSLTSQPGGPDRTASSRFGWEVHTPLAAAWIPPGSRGRLGRAQESFLSLDKANVIVQTLQIPDEGGGLLLRLREVAGKSTMVRISSSLFRTSRVTVALLDLAGHETESRTVGRAEIAVPIKAFGIQTVMIKPRSS